MTCKCASSWLNTRATFPAQCKELEDSCVLCDWSGQPWSQCFHGENRSFPKSFWQKLPLLWLASRNNPWLCGKFCGGHSTKCNISESNNTSISLKNRCSRTLEQNRFGCVCTVVFYLWTGTRIQVGGNSYIGTTTDHYTLQSSTFKAYLAYQSCRRDHASPCPPPPRPPPPPCVCVSVSGTAGWNVWRSIAKCHK